MKKGRKRVPGHLKGLPRRTTLTPAVVVVHIARGVSVQRIKTDKQVITSYVWSPYPDPADQLPPTGK